MVRHILFDLDGTLLPMKLEDFVKAYFLSLTKTLAPLGYDPKTLVNNMWLCSEAMVKNASEMTNEQIFWKYFADVYGEKAYAHKPLLDEYYRTGFSEAKRVCGYDPSAARTIDALRERGFKLTLASNPIFPKIAQQIRLGWAGVDPNAFDLYTSYENMHSCKPNPEYYREIVRLLDCDPSDCLMVGNDVEEDMIARTIGMHVYLLPKCLINRKNKDISQYPHGDFDELLRFAENL